VPAALEYSGLRELIKALKNIDLHLVNELKEALAEVGEEVRKEAQHLFEPFDTYSAQGFETRVRPGSEALVVVGQKLKKTTGTKPSWGALQMTEALIPARQIKYTEASVILEQKVGGLLHRNGF
jgi:hypothetical protein